MTKNMGTADRVVRTLFALAVAVLYFSGKTRRTPAIVLGVFAIAFVLSSLVERCPRYPLFGLSTRKPPTGPSSAA